MAEHIEREPLLEVMEGLYNHHLTMGNYSADSATQDCIEAVTNAPTTDVVPVVRCKDCKYYEIHKPSVTLNCERDGRLIPMMPDDYCSYGERR